MGLSIPCLGCGGPQYQPLTTFFFDSINYPSLILLFTAAIIFAFFINRRFLITWNLFIIFSVLAIPEIYDQIINIIKHNFFSTDWLIRNLSINLLYSVFLGISSFMFSFLFAKVPIINSTKQSLYKLGKPFIYTLTYLTTIVVVIAIQLKKIGLVGLVRQFGSFYTFDYSTIYIIFVVYFVFMTAISLTWVISFVKISKISEKNNQVTENKKSDWIHLVIAAFVFFVILLIGRYVEIRTA